MPLGQVAPAGGRGTPVRGNNTRTGAAGKPDSAKSANKKSEVTRRKKRKAMRADLEIQAKELLKKY